ncbi:MAG TPA: hypothetical protein PKO06_09075 [Candidatus Ozemobacteraceae bacterium]|nr:hypothetical protein [Candidatus Ozemobacteraceae bacterium]
MISIKGKVEKGKGESRNTIREQMPFFKDCFPEVADCQHGTLNIRLEKPLIILHPDFTTEPVPWHPALRISKKGEVFQFVRARLAIDGQEPTPVWIYRAQFSPYRDDPYVAEVLAPPLKFSGHPSCRLELATNAFEGIVIKGENRQQKGRKAPA